ncbi:MAG: phage tail tape measure protein [Thalassobaculum sp.]
MASAVENLLVRIDATTEQLRREMKRADDTVQSSQRKIDRSLNKIDTGFDRVGRGISGATKLLGLFGVALSAGALVGFTRQTVQAADALAKTADKLGVTIEALQEFRFAAERSGVEANTLDMAMQRFVRRLGEAQAGTGELLPVIKQYGIALRDANGQARSAEEVLTDYANAVAGAGSQQEKLRLAFKAFDSEGAALVNLLRRGATGIEELREQAREAGVVLGGELARQAEILNDRMAVLDKRMEVAATRVLLSLEPALSSGVGLFDRFSLGLARLIDQFAEVNELGLGPLEAQAEGLRTKIQLLEQTNASDWFGGLSGARADLAEVEARIEAIRTGAVALNSGGSSVVDGLIPSASLNAVNDNLDDLQAKVFAAAGALEQIGMAGRDALKAFEQQTELLQRADRLADSFNKTNVKAIDSGETSCSDGRRLSADTGGVDGAG